MPARVRTVLSLAFPLPQGTLGFFLVLGEGLLLHLRLPLTVSKTRCTVPWNCGVSVAATSYKQHPLA